MMYKIDGHNFIIIDHTSKSLTVKIKLGNGESDLYIQFSITGNDIDFRYISAGEDGFGLRKDYYATTIGRLNDYVGPKRIDAFELPEKYKKIITFVLEKYENEESDFTFNPDFRFAGFK